MAKLPEVTPDNFEELVLKSTKPVLVDFWATWCPPCHRFEPVLKEVAEELSSDFHVYKFDAGTHDDIAEDYGISGFPTFIIFKNGEEILREIGVSKSKQEFILMMKQSLNS